MPRRPASRLLEERIWTLRCQGHRHALITTWTGLSSGSITRITRQARRRRGAARTPSPAPWRFPNRLLGGRPTVLSPLSPCSPSRT